MSKPRLLFSLTVVSLVVSVVAMGFAIFLYKRAEIVRNNVNELIKLQAVSIVELQKYNDDEIKPGIRAFDGNLNAGMSLYFEYPSEWQDSSILGEQFPPAFGGGSSWKVYFNGWAMLPSPLTMTAYWNNPTNNVEYPFRIMFPEMDEALLADAFFSNHYSTEKACAAWKKLYNLDEKCEKFEDKADFIDYTDKERNVRKKVWFVTTEFGRSGSEAERRGESKSTVVATLPYNGIVIEQDLFNYDGFPNIDKEVEAVIRSIKLK